MTNSNFIFEIELIWDHTSCCRWCFSRLAYRSLGQEVFCTVQEADYEIASYACQHSSMGILGQDSDFLIYDRFVLANKMFSVFFW